MTQSLLTRKDWLRAFFKDFREGPLAKRDLTQAENNSLETPFSAFRAFKFVLRFALTVLVFIIQIKIRKAHK